MSYQSFIKDLLVRIEQQGWTWRKGNGHYVLYPADKAMPCVTVSSSPSDGNAYRQVLRQIKKLGFAE